MPLFASIRNFSRRSASELLFLATLLTLLAITAWIYLPGIHGPPVLDDFNNLSPLGQYGGVSDFDTFRNFVFGNQSGPTGRPVSMLSFLIDAQDWPADISQFKYTNVMIHLLCGTVFCWLGFLLAQMLGMTKQGSIQVALIVAMLWLVHPLNVSTALYIVQRMTQMATLFAGLSIVFYLLGRRALPVNARLAYVYLALCLFPFGLLSVLSKENGALLLLLIAMMEGLFFRQLPTTALFRLWFRVGILVPLALVIGFLIYAAPENLDLYNYRAFTLGERLLTETRVLSTYIWKIFFPDQLLGSVFHDSYPASTGLLTPITTALSSLFLIALLTLAWLARHRQPVFSFGVFWFFVMHLIESTYVPLELYFEHRNYMPMFGPLFALGWYLRLLMASVADKTLKVIAGVFVGGIFCLSTWLTWNVAGVWGNDGRFYSYMAAQWPDSIRAQLVYAEYLDSVGQREQALEQHYILREYHPRELVVLLSLWNFACKYNLEQPMSLADITALPDLDFKLGIISYHIDTLQNNLSSNRCPRPSRQELVNFYERIAEFPMPDGRSALFRYSYANLFILLGDSENALAQLELAADINPAVNYRMRQAVIAGLMGAWDRALAYIDQAAELDAARNPLLPSRMPEIESVRRVMREQRELSLQ